MAKKDDFAQGYFEQSAAARNDFNTFDKEINDSVGKAMAAYANLAEQKPEELFGIKPTDRDRFFVKHFLDPGVLRAATSSSGGTEASGNDITGSNPLSVAAIADALAKVASSEGGAKIIEELLSHVRAEKEFFKETGKEIFDWILGD